jgi:hypothetical protein
MPELCSIRALAAAALSLLASKEFNIPRIKQLARERGGIRYFEKKC